MEKLLFLVVFSASMASNVFKTSDVAHSTFRPGKDLAVFFAVEKYQNGKLTNLQNPIKNARDLAAVLKSRFGFETEILENPTQDRIIAKLNELARQYTRNEDGNHPSDGQLFLFFSGHGLSEDENGYFLPADADPAKPWDKGIAYEIWRPKIDKINCRHIFVAIDACYSVRFDPDWKNKTDGEFKRPGEMTDSQRALANYEKYKARVFFTSDNKEDQTPDRSNFAKKLMEGLRTASAGDGFLTSRQIFANFVEGATPTPRAGTFGNDEASSAFLFYDLVKEEKSNAVSIPSGSEVDDRAYSKAESRNTTESYQDYLDIFPGGSHKAEAEAAIIKFQSVELKQKKIDQAIRVNDILISPVEITNSGEEISNSRASKVTKVKICFTTEANQVVEAGKEIFYVCIIDPMGAPLSIERLGSGVAFDEKSGIDLRYTFIAACNYVNNEMQVCGAWRPGQTFIKGKYVVEVRNKGYTVSSAHFTLK